AYSASPASLFTIDFRDLTNRMAANSAFHVLSERSLRMIHRFASVFVLPVLFASTLTTGQIASAPEPNPVLYLARTESVVTRGKRYIRYRYDVANKDAYPAEMFAPAPQLPPCGANRKASRTRVDIYGQNGKRLYGFCDLARPSDLGHIW